eukprot:gene12846-3592_t
MVDAYGAITWWGFSPALDLQEQDALSVLLIGAADLRHILKTCALRRRHKNSKLQFFVVENNLEVIARQMLFISIIFESKDSLGLKEKVELFIELFGNSLMRPKTDEFLKHRCTDLIRFVTSPEYLEQNLPFLDLSSLKFKERDMLEGIFKFWKNVEQKYFDIPALWEQRIRQHLSTRYDSRINVYDWDYTMKLKEKAPIINFREYKTWRESGVAFELRDDSSYEVPNRTLASGIVIKKDGEKFARRGYWGDVVNSPYLSYGIESEEKSLFKKNNDIYVKTATNVTEHNVTAWIYEMMTGEAYSLCPLKNSNMTKKLSPRSELSEVKEETEDAEKSEAKAGEQKPSSDGIATPKYDSMEDVKITFLPLGSVPDLSRKSKYKGLFDVIFLSNSFMLDLRHEHRVEYNKKVKAMAESLGFKLLSDVTVS